MTGQEQTHNHHCSADMLLLALSSQFHIHLHGVSSMAGITPASQEGDPLHWDFFIQLILLPTLSNSCAFPGRFFQPQPAFPL